MNTKRVLLIASVSSLLLACGSGSSQGGLPPQGNETDRSDTKILGPHKYGVGQYHHGLEVKNNKRAILFYREGEKDDTFANAKLTDDGEKIIISNTVIDLSKEVDTDELFVKAFHKGLKSVRGLTVVNRNAKAGANLFIGEQTALNDIPTRGKFYYNSINQYGGRIDPHGSAWIVDFGNRHITSNYLDRSHQYQATIHGNTFSGSKSFDYAGSQVDTYMTGGFYGKNATEMAGWRTQKQAIGKSTRFLQETYQIAAQKGKTAK